MGAALLLFKLHLKHLTDHSKEISPMLTINAYLCNYAYKQYYAYLHIQIHTYDNF